jgi:hypothetical protein
LLQVLALDASNVEAIACLAADHFYSDQPELALRYYRRLLQVRACKHQLGVSDAAAMFAHGCMLLVLSLPLFCTMQGLCCFLQCSA